MCSSLIKTAERLCPALRSEAEELAREFTQLFGLFQACHGIYDSRHQLKDEEIKTLRKSINRWGINIKDSSYLYLVFNRIQHQALHELLPKSLP